MKLTLTAQEINRCSIKTISNEVRFLNKNDILKDNQITYSRMLKQKLKLVIPGVKYGVKNKKDSGSVNKKIYYGCNHKPLCKGINLKYMGMDHKIGEALTFTIEGECVECTSLLSPKSVQSVGSDFSKKFFEKISENVNMVINSAEKLHTHSDQINLLKSIPKLMADISNSIVNVVKSYDNEDQVVPVNQENPQTLISPTNLILFGPPMTAQTPATTFHHRQTLTPQTNNHQSRSPSPTPIRRRPQKNVNHFNDSDEDRSLSPKPIKRPRPRIISSFFGNDSDDELSTIPENITLIAASTSLENSTNLSPKVPYKLSKTAKNLLIR